MEENLLIHVSRQAMACEFEVCFPDGSCPGGADFALEALDEVETLEEQLSYFRATSEISRVNLLAAEEPVEVETRLFHLLSLALQLHRETGGAYDITATPLWETWGFARRAGKIPSDADLAEARQNVGSQFVELDPERRTVRFRKPGVKINLGSIGKGFALDCCAERLGALGMRNFLIQGGKSSAIARDDVQREERSAAAAGRPELGAGWQIGVPHPRQPGKRFGVLRLHNRALGTSSAQFQSFRHQGHRYGHILDPRTGLPAENTLSATVLAPSAALADALSTAFFVLGPEASLDYCQKHPEIGAVLFRVGSTGGVDFYQAGLAGNDWVSGPEVDCRP
jgi:FAD:protein FMN transferase